tara:strand:+ start:1097 stop:1360 length:264 start_codon:yes stop_codon:yes gene_type:complete
MGIEFHSNIPGFEHEKGFEFGPEDTSQLVFSVKTARNDLFVTTNKGEARRVACAACGEVRSKEFPMDFRFMPNPMDFEEDDTGFEQH